MVWVKVDDGFPNNPKAMVAGERLGKNGLGRVMAVWLEILCHANQHLTDGLIRTAVAKLLRADKDPLEVMDAMARAGMLNCVEDGWEICNYLDYQPSREKVLAKRAKDRHRKSNHSGDAPDSVSSPNGIFVESADAVSGVAVESGSPGPARPNPASGEASQVQRAARAPRPPDRNLGVLTKLAHQALDRRDAGEIPGPDVREELKRQAAQSGIAYEGDQVTKALDSAEAQRGRLMSTGRRDL